MLATSSLGAVWSSCSPDFGVNGVIDRFGQIQPKVLFTAGSYQYGGKRFDCLDKIAQVTAQIASIERVIVVPYTERPTDIRSEEHTSELQSLMRISYAVFCLKKKKTNI